MIRAVTFHEDVYYAYFRPYRHPQSAFNIWGGLGLETFGTDLQLARSFNANFVWTLVEGGSGPDPWITPGLHVVNRLCYLVTQVPHYGAPIEFRTEGRPRPVTAIGLARRITMLRRVLVEHQGRLRL